MDNLTHSLTGWAISRVFPQKSWGTWTTPTAILAANLPDFEFLFVSQSDKPAYLMYHRGWSHCLLGIAGEILLFSAIVMFVGWLRRARMLPEHRPTWRRVFPLVTIAAFSHLLLDWWNTYGVNPWFPFDTTRYHADVTFLVDPWIWLMLLTGILLGTPLRRFAEALPLSTRQRSVTSVALVIISLLMSLILIWGASVSILPWMTPILWMSGMIIAWLTRCLLISTIRPRLLGWITIGVVSLYVMSLGLISETCLQRGLAYFKRHHQATIDSQSANPVPSIPWRYEVLIQTQERIYQYSINLATSSVEEVRDEAHQLHNPILKQVTEHRNYIAWKQFARHPIARHVDQELILGDARYQVIPGRRDWTELRIPLSPDP